MEIYFGGAAFILFFFFENITEVEIAGLHMFYLGISVVIIYWPEPT